MKTYKYLFWGLGGLAIAAIAWVIYDQVKKAQARKLEDKKVEDAIVAETGGVKPPVKVIPTLEEVTAPEPETMAGGTKN